MTTSSRYTYWVIMYQSVAGVRKQTVGAATEEAARRVFAEIKPMCEILTVEKEVQP